MIKLMNTLNLIPILALVSLLSACDGGLFGTGSGDIIDADSVDGVSMNGEIPEQAPDESDDSGIDQTPEEVNEETDQEEGQAGEAESEGDVLQSVTVTLSFSNNTPSGLGSEAEDIPALKIINLTELDLSASSDSTESIEVASVSAIAQSTSSLLPVVIGESAVNVTGEAQNEILISLDPLNASEDSLTTLIVAPDEQANSPSDAAFRAVAVDTRAVSTSEAVAEIRVVNIANSNANSVPEIVLMPVGDNPNGSSVVLYNSQTAQENLTTYELVGAGDYAISTSDNSFSQQLITADPGSVLTLVITGQPLTPVYIELDSLP